MRAYKPSHLTLYITVKGAQWYVKNGGGGGGYGGGNPPPFFF